MLSFAMMRPSLKDHLLDLVFPSLCAGCGAHCPAPLCGSCALSLSRRAVRGESDLSTPGHTVAFGGFRAAGDYRGALKDMVLRLRTPSAGSPLRWPRLCSPRLETIRATCSLRP